MAGKPLWRRAFDDVDRRIAGPVEAAARSDAFGDALTLALRAQRRVQRLLEKRTRRALHLVNLPTATDVRRLQEQVAALRREVRQLDEDRRP
jgi:polyhydroxyalkanoate synthesis regulator phasin